MSTTKVIDVIRELQDFGCKVEVSDYWTDEKEVKDEYGIDLIINPQPLSNKMYDAVILAVAHDQYKKLSPINDGQSTIVYNIKGILEYADGKLQ